MSSQHGRPSATRRGFTLCEITIALAILAIGVLGSAGLLALAARTLARAEVLAHIATAAAEIGDSLAAAQLTSDGSRALPLGEASWLVEHQQRVTRIGLLLRADRPGGRDSLFSTIIMPDSVPALRRQWNEGSQSPSWW